jgi:hypothetical protein
VARAVARVALQRVGGLSHLDLDDGGATGDVFTPRPEHRARYDELQTQFIAAFDALRPICEALNR